MLKLNASYSKKVPAEGEYTSQSYHCSVELELSDAMDPDALKAKIHETFELVRTSVEAELHGEARPAMPPVTVQPMPVRVLPQAPAPNGRGNGQDPQKATNKQVRYLLDLARTRGIQLSALNQRVQAEHGVRSVYDLGRKAASQLVDELKAA